MQDPHKSQGAGVVALAATALAVVYALSMGPAKWIDVRCGNELYRESQAYKTLYAPIHLLCSHSIACKNARESYLSLFGVDARRLNLDAMFRKMENFIE